MASVSEEKTKGLTADKLMNIEGYPTAQNVTVDGVTWFKEDSYKNTAYHKLYEVFAKASKKQSMRSRGTPDFIVTLDNSEIIVVIEDRVNLLSVGESQKIPCYELAQIVFS